MFFGLLNTGDPFVPLARLHRSHAGDLSTTRTDVPPPAPSRLVPHARSRPRTGHSDCTFVPHGCRTRDRIARPAGAEERKMTHRTWTSAAAVLIALTLGPTAVFAQGVQTGIITGTVTSEDGLSLPGATVTVTAPTLQGSRSTVTDVNGNYVIRGLPPGEYEVTTGDERHEAAEGADGRRARPHDHGRCATLAGRRRRSRPGRRAGVAGRREPGRRRQLPQGGNRPPAGSDARRRRSRSSRPG